MKSSKGKVRIVIIILAIIGTLTIIDNTFRLGNEVVRTVSKHKWSYIPFKN